MTNTKPLVRYRISNLKALNNLPPREKLVIEMRLGIGEFNRPHTFREIREKLGLKTDTRPRQIEAKALQRLKIPSMDCKVTLNY